MTRLRCVFCALTAATLLLMPAATARAGELQLSIANGRVTLVADNVPVRTILSEWARLGQTKIINAEKLAGGPVTLRLVNTPEAQALDILLRSASGYMAAPRAAGNVGASQFDRILILASSRPTQSGPAPATNFQNMNQRFQPPPAMLQPVEPDEGGDESDDEKQPNVPANTPAMLPGQPGFQVPNANQPVPGAPGFVPPAVQQPPPGQVNAPITAPRPGLLPPPQQPQPNPNRPIPR